MCKKSIKPFCDCPSDTGVFFSAWLVYLFLFCYFRLSPRWLRITCKTDFDQLDVDKPETSRCVFDCGFLFRRERFRIGLLDRVAVKW